MGNTRRASVAVAALATLALTVSACSSGGGDDKSAPSDASSPSATPQGVQIDAAHSVGAMADFQVGTTFKATEPIEPTLLYRDHPNYPVKDDWTIFQSLTANQNVTFKRTDVPLADWDAKKALILGAGDAPEIIPVTYPGQETQFVAGGSILPVSDYVQYMPNFEKKVKDWGLQDELDTHRQADGKYYLLPGLLQSPSVQYSVVVNDDMWKKAGITSDPTTWDEFAQDLVKVKAANPSVKYAFSDRWNQQNNQALGAFLQYVAPNFGTAAGWGYSNTWFDQKSGKFVLTGTTDEYKQLVTYATGLVSDGLLDPEITQTDDQAIQKFVTGESATISGNTQEISNYRSKAPGVNMHLIVLPDGPAGGNLAPGRLTQGVMLSSSIKDDPHFKAILQFIDWLYYSDEGLEFTQWGVQGTTFTKDASGVRSLLPDVGWNALNPNAPKKLNADFGFSNGVFMAANGASDDLVQSVMSPEIATWTKDVIAKKKVLPVAPAASLTSDELESAGLLDTQIKDAVNAATAKFITGQTPLSDWDKYVAQINGLGADQLIDTYNTALARTKG